VRTLALYGTTPSPVTAGAVTTGVGAAGAAASSSTASALAFTGAHITSEVVLGFGLIFLGAGLVKAVRRRPHQL
jgi:hypothetical protein